MLIRFGFKNENIDSTTESEKALRILNRNNFDIVFCDYNMNHNIDGALILDEVKTRGMLESSSVFICLTGDNSLSVITYFIELEPDDYLIKPFKANDLIERLKKIVKRKEALYYLIDLVDNKQYQDAIYLCDELKFDNPQYTPYIMRIEADCHLKLENFNTAKQIYLSASKEYESLWPSIGYGNVLRVEGELAKAKEIFNEILKDRPTNPLARKQLAMCMLASNDILGAISEFKFLKKINPANPYRDLVIANLILSKGDFFSSSQEYKKYLDKVTGTTKFDLNISCISALSKLLAVINNTDNEKDKDIIENVTEEIFHIRDEYIKNDSENRNLDASLKSMASILSIVRNNFHDGYLLAISIRDEALSYSNFYTAIIKSQMYAICGIVNDYKESMNIAKSLIGKEIDESIMLSKLELYKGLINQTNDRVSKSQRIKNKSIKLREKKKPKSAFDFAYRAYKLTPFDSEICLLILELIALSTPTKIPKNIITNLVKSCFWTVTHDKKSTETHKQLAIKFKKNLDIKLEKDQIQTI